MTTEPSVENISNADTIEDTLNDINSSDQPHCITYPMLLNKCQSDELYQLLATTIETGFPNTRHQSSPNIQEYCEVREHLTVSDHFVLLDKHIIIPKKFRKQILNNLQFNN